MADVEKSVKISYCVRGLLFFFFPEILPVFCFLYFEGILLGVYLFRIFFAEIGLKS